MSSELKEEEDGIYLNGLGLWLKLLLYHWYLFNIYLRYYFDYLMRI